MSGKELSITRCRRCLDRYRFDGFATARSARNYLSESIFMSYSNGMVRLVRTVSANRSLGSKLA